MNLQQGNDKVTQDSNSRQWNAQTKQTHKKWDMKA